MRWPIRLVAAPRWTIARSGTRPARWTLLALPVGPTVRTIRARRTFALTSLAAIAALTVREAPPLLVSWNPEPLAGVHVRAAGAPAWTAPLALAVARLAQGFLALLLG